MYEIWSRIKAFSSVRARLFPPWITALSLSIGGYMGIVQYYDANRSDRVLRSLEYYENFVEMDRYNKSLRITQGILIDGFRKKREGHGKCAFANESESFGRDHEVEIYNLLYHYNMVIQCGLNGACDSRTSFSLYEQDMLNFVNAFCYYIKSESCNWEEDLSRDRAIVRFIIDHTSASPKFMCDHSFTCKQFREMCPINESD